MPQNKKNTRVVFNPQLSQQALHGAPSANVQAISSQLRSPERETCGALKNPMPEIARSLKDIFFAIPRWLEEFS